ncbi:DNA topoisomerase I, mitochondrial-like isoform X2 [Antedon mediterranea]
MSSPSKHVKSNHHTSDVLDKKPNDKKHKSSSLTDGSSKPKNGVSSSGDIHKSSNQHNSSAHSKQHSGEKKSSSKTIKPSNQKVEKRVKTEPGEFKVKKEPINSSPKKKVDGHSKDNSVVVKSEKCLKRPHSSADESSIKKIKVKEEQEPKRKEVKTKKRKSEEVDDDFVSKKQKDKKHKKASKHKIKGESKKKKEEETVWKWWEEEGHADGVKWKFLEHKGPVFAPEYEPLPKSVKFYYDGAEMQLSVKAEEVAGFYARMLDHDYTTRDVFNNNFFKDWRKEMTDLERKTITTLKKCNFKKMQEYFLMKTEERKAMSKEEKNKIKEKNAEILEEYGYCTIDSHKEKIGNFRIEPPGLFRGRGEHPKQGMLKRRTLAEDVIINCSKDSNIPKAPAGHKWKQVTHDNKVSWLASWTENVQGQIKYVMLGASSRVKGEKDWQKYEMARSLKQHVDRIRSQYREDFRSKEMRVRQRAVALYFIDKLALRAGNEKDEETADTVGCCSLRVEHLTLHEELDGKEFVVEFDFLGKDSIRYYNKVSVEKRAFKNLKLFMDNKQPGDDLFDRLNTTILNRYLQELMEGLTAKVFRTFNASFTLQNQLDELTNPDDSIAAKVLSYNRANRAVAILCNHQRAVPKTFEKSMTNLQEKIKKKKDDVKKVKKEYKAMKVEYKNSRNDKLKIALEKKKKQVERLDEQLTKLEVSATDKEENKEIALGTSKLNYLDPRISVAWCKKWEVPLEKVYNKTQRTKFSWAIDMADADYVF